MGLAKDIVKDNKKILLLTLGLFVMSIIGIFLLRENFLGTNSGIVKPGLYTQPEEVLEEDIDYGAIIKTEYGDIQIDLYEDTTPNAVNSFVFLAGEDFYNGLTFYKVIPNFVIQAGDHVGDGTGTPGYSLKEDTTPIKVEEYSVCMANASQFFIVPQGADVNQLLDYPVIGEVTSGFAVVDTIEKVPIDENYKPVNDITINSVLVLED
jgi:cyclophilin family peptidyl-prolyl cis-trans isomerase